MDGITLHTPRAAFTAEAAVFVSAGASANPRAAQTAWASRNSVSKHPGRASSAAEAAVFLSTVTPAVSSLAEATEATAFAAAAATSAPEAAVFVPAVHSTISRVAETAWPASLPD
jgi:hypothetical protein